MEEKNPETAGRGPVKLLLADDDASIRSLAAFHLRGGDWDVVFVADAFQALAACASRRFDLLLLDLNMPGGGGEAVVKGLGAQCPPALALSASCLDEGFVLPEGLAGAVPKPFTGESLLDGVRSHLPARSSTVQDGRNAAGAGWAREALGGTDPALAHLLPKVLRGMESDVQACSGALAEESYPVLGERAHAMRGAASCYGLEELAEAAQELERAARKKDAQASGEALERVRELLRGRMS